MRKIVPAFAAFMLAAGLFGCSGGSVENGADENAGQASEGGSASQQAVAVNQSPDKYTWYVKNYVGMNAASVGYAAMGGFRADAYGAGYLKVVYRTPDGSHLDSDDEEQLKGYVVTGQDLAPNTELKYTFQLDDEGEEYDNLLESQNYDEIVLAVTEVGKGTNGTEDLTVIESSPDKYTRYVKDYVGRNLADCGYVSLGGFLADHYGNGYVRFDLVADDGAYIDAEDEDSLAGYVVTSQNIAPNTAIQLAYDVDADGSEYDTLVSSQSVTNITLNVSKLDTEQSA